ncbi:uncharacterized protein LOC125077446 [Vanessa atalanta]|uniref:uncharacterized protein LOC125077446 n=1 Tax=Vanessa atalanta TaxID=42275 RepID=UPI001FCDA292|nr:uncharacterized protein LOC125077446 [Vanessa atalanta]
MMVVPIVAVGRTARPTVTVCVLDRKDRGRTPAPGTLDSKYPASTPGPVEAHSRDNGKTANGTVWAWKRATAGCTGASGLKATRAATASDRAVQATPSTRAPGPTASKTDMVQKHTPMAEHTKDNGCEDSGMDTECVHRHPSVWHLTTAGVRGITADRSHHWRRRRARRTPPTGEQHEWTMPEVASSLKPALMSHRVDEVLLLRRLKRDFLPNYVSNAVPVSWTSAARARYGQAAQAAPLHPGCRRSKARIPLLREAPCIPTLTPVSLLRMNTWMPV